MLSQNGPFVWACVNESMELVRAMLADPRLDLSLPKLASRALVSLCLLATSFHFHMLGTRADSSGKSVSRAYKVSICDESGHSRSHAC